MSTAYQRATASTPAEPEALLLEHERACDETDYRVWERSHRLDLFQPTRPQLEFLNLDVQTALFWGGVRTGKSTILDVDCAHYLRGTHPRQYHRAPISIGYAGRSWMQMVDRCRSLWSYMDPRWFRPRIDLSEGAVKGQRSTILTAVSGPGAGSQIRLCTFEMGSLAIQGWTIHRWLLDEPPKQAFYTECRSRILTTGGALRMGFCPTLAHVGQTGHDLDWVWSMVDSGAIGLVHAPLSVENVTPATGRIRVPLISRRDLAAFSSEIPARDRAMRLGMSRYPESEGSYFGSWSRDLIRERQLPAGWYLGIGIDHGSKPGRQRVTLIAVSGRGQDAQVHVLRHYMSEGRGDDNTTARAILDMLASTGHSLDDVDFWVGDRAHAGDRAGGKASNARLQRAIAQAIGINLEGKEWRKKLPKPLFRMWVPYKYEGSVWDGMEILHQLQVRRTITIDPSCTPLIEDIENWRGSYSDPHKDGLDSLRYIVVPMIAIDWHRPA